MKVIFLDIDIREDMHNCIRLLEMEEGSYPLEECLQTEELQTWHQKYAYPYFPVQIQG